MKRKKGVWVAWNEAMEAGARTNVSLAANTPPSCQRKLTFQNGTETDGSGGNGSGVGRGRYDRMERRLTKGVSFGPQMRASHVKKSDSEIGPKHTPAREERD